MASTKYPLDDGPDPVATTSRPRVGSRLWDKLDHIQSLIEGHGANTEAGDDTTPTVSFEPDPADLPVVAGDEPEEEPGEQSANGEGSTNLAFEKPARYRFPHRRRVEVGS